MRVKKWITVITTTLGLAGACFAEKEQTVQQLQMTACLADKLPSSYPVLAENNVYKIVSVPSSEISKLTLLADKFNCGRFVNVTAQLNASHSAQSLLAAKLPLVSEKKWEIKHEAAVNGALMDVNVENILATLTHLTEFQNRSAELQKGVEAANWLKSQFDSLVQQSGRDDVDSFFVKTGAYYKQPSLVTVINKNSQAPGIVIGAHMDTLEGRMPGAGDDGSGSSSVMEIARILLNSKQAFNRPIYIIWYAAEEKGLVGSQYVVKYFQKHHIPVLAALQFDMTGFRNNRNDPTMWVFRDYTNEGLTNFVADLIKSYINVPVGESECGYGCSDHASWTAIGVPAAFPCETDFEHHNPNIHTARDTMDRLTPEHMVNFSKLGLAFAIELASD